MTLKSSLTDYHSDGTGVINFFMLTKDTHSRFNIAVHVPLKGLIRSILIYSAYDMHRVFFVPMIYNFN